MNIRELRNRKHALGATIVSKGSSFNKDRYTEKYDKEYTFTSMLYESDLLFSDCVVFPDRPQFGLPAMTLVLEDESVKHIKSDRVSYLNRAFRIRGENKSDQAPKRWLNGDMYETATEAVDRLLGYGFKSLDKGSNRAPELDGALVIVNYCIDGSYSNLSIVGEDTIEHEHRFDNLWQFENYLPKVSLLRAYKTLNDAIIYHGAERIGVMKINLILNDAKHEPECPDLSDFSDSMNLAHRLKHTCIRDEKLIIDWIPEEMKDADRSKPDYRLYILRHIEIKLHRLSGHYVNDFPKKKCISGYINSNGILCFEQDMEVTMVDDKIINVSKGCYFIESAAGMGLTHLPTYEKMINALKAPVSPKKSRLSGLTSVNNTTDYGKLGPAIKSRKITKVNFDDGGENNKARKPNRFR